MMLDEECDLSIHPTKLFLRSIISKVLYKDLRLIYFAFSSPLTLLILNKSTLPPTLNKLLNCLNDNNISIETGYFHCQIIIQIIEMYIHIILPISMGKKP